MEYITKAQAIDYIKSMEVLIGCTGVSVLTKGIEGLEAEPQWISVNDRLPECKEDVLMYFDTGNCAVGFWHEQDEFLTFWSAYTDDGWFTDCDCEPLYWMPLPKPPKEG